MPTRSEVYEKVVLRQLYPMPKPLFPEGQGVDFHLLSLIFVFSTRGDLLEKVFPVNGSPDPEALYRAGVGVDPQRAKPALVESLEPYRDAFATIQRAWLELSDYEDPPCPDDEKTRTIVELTKHL